MGRPVCLGHAREPGRSQSSRLPRQDQMSGSCFKLHGGLLFIHSGSAPSPKEVPWNARQALMILAAPKIVQRRQGGLAGAIGPSPALRLQAQQQVMAAGQRPGTFFMRGTVSVMPLLAVIIPGEESRHFSLPVLKCQARYKHRPRSLTSTHIP